MLAQFDLHRSLHGIPPRVDQFKGEAALPVFLDVEFGLPLDRTALGLLCPVERGRGRTGLPTHVLNTLWADRPRAHQRLAPVQIGIVLGNLLEGTAHTGDLFTAETENSRTRLHSAVDTLNKTFGMNIQAAGEVGH